MVCRLDGAGRVRRRERSVHRRLGHLAAQPGDQHACAVQRRSGADVSRSPGDAVQLDLRRRVRRAWIPDATCLHAKRNVRVVRASSTTSARKKVFTGEADYRGHRRPSCGRDPSRPARPKHDGSDAVLFRSGGRRPSAGRRSFAYQWDFGDGRRLGSAQSGITTRRPPR